MAPHDLRMLSLQAFPSRVNADVRTWLKALQGVMPVNCHIGAEDAIALDKYSKFQQNEEKLQFKDEKK